MSDQIQDFKESEYERPNQSWVNSPVGSVGTQDETTLRMRSIRFQRTITTLAITAFTVGALIIGFNSPYRNEILVPGPLASSHAQLLNERGVDRCVACHPAGDKTFTQWVAQAFTGHSKNGESKCQSDLCMECHKNNISEEFALTPHNVDPKLLLEKTEQFHEVSYRNSSILSNVKRQSKELACSVCHREHHGETDLTKLTDQQCQSCHSSNYHSFETDHPEFTTWPNMRRSRIAFDHSSHAMKHYPGLKTMFECSQCHVDDSSQNVKLLAPYEKTCAHCHDQKIRDNGAVGLAVFSLPMLDLEEFESANIDVGEWPEYASGEFDGGLPPAMKLLLMADEKAKTALNYFGENFDFSDVESDDRQQLTYASELVWSVKYLLYDLAVHGQETIRERLETVLERKVSAVEVSELGAGLNELVFQDAARRWLPKLKVEVAKKRWGSTAMKIGWIPGEILMRYEARQDELLAPNPLNGLIKPVNDVPNPSPVADVPAESQAIVEEDRYPAELKHQPVERPIAQTPPPAEMPQEPAANEQPIFEQPRNSTPMVELKSADQLRPMDADTLAENPLRGAVQPEQSPLNPTTTPNQSVVQQPIQIQAPNQTVQQPVQPTQQPETQQAQSQPQRSPMRAIPKNLPLPTPAQLQSKDPSVLAKNPLHRLFGKSFGATASAGQATRPPAQQPIAVPPVRRPNEIEPTTPNQVVQQDPVEVVEPFSQPVKPGVYDNSELTQPMNTESEELKILRGAVPVVSAGGWFRDDQMLQVSYRPGGHADELLKNWTELLARVPNAHVHPATAALFTQLTSSQGVGTCKSCHTIDQLEDQTFDVNWRAEYRDVTFRSFTRFSHGPHVMQPDLQDCSHCHELDPERSNKDSFASFVPAMATSNFHPIQKSNCSSCHQEGKTNSGCTQCHNYHIGSKVIGTNHK